MKHFLIDNPILQSLNKKERFVLDANNGELRERILFYTDRIGHYKTIIINGADKACLFSSNDPITIEQAKFQYTFWFEAMVWFMRTQMEEKEQSKEDTKKE